MGNYAIYSVKGVVPISCVAAENHLVGLHAHNVQSSSIFVEDTLSFCLTK